MGTKAPYFDVWWDELQHQYFRADAFALKSRPDTEMQFADQTDWPATADAIQDQSTSMTGFLD